MKVGDMVRNVMPVRTNPVVHKKPVGSGYLGVVVALRVAGIGSEFTSRSTDYVDVVLSVDGTSVYCGNYHAGHFEAIA